MGHYADKEKAKALAKALAPEVMITPTVAVWKLGPGAQARDLEDFLRPYLGKRFVAKPAHASGKVLLLDRVGPGDVEALFKAADRDYFYRGGEPQYRGLERRVLVERSLALPGKAPPADYRFHCCKGVPWFGAADVGRFVDLREHHFTVPDYRPVFLQAKGKRPSRLPGRPPRFEKMLRVASRLSRPFDYVRVDLYQTKRGVHFGEFTFTPMVGLFKFTDPGFSKWLLARALAPGRAVPLPMEWRGLPSSK